MKTKKVPKIVSSEENPRSFVFIMKDDIIQSINGDNSLELVKLRHPKTGEGAYFAINKKVHEILKFSEDKRSYFIDESIASNGDLYLSTPIDPLFLIIPYLVKAKHCCPLDQILMDEEFPDIDRLLECEGINQLYRIADRRGDESLNAYAYNEDKTLMWLRKKLNIISDLLQNKGIHVSSNTAISANYVKSENTLDPLESYLRYALGMLSEYLQPELVTRLYDSVGLTVEEKKVNTITNENLTGDNKRKETDANDEIDRKKIKLEENQEIKFKSPTGKVEKKQSAKDQAMAKAAKGSKNISSFFKKK